MVTRKEKEKTDWGELLKPLLKEGPICLSALVVALAALFLAAGAAAPHLAGAWSAVQPSAVAATPSPAIVP